MKICPNCKQTVSDTAKFCRKCGFNIKKYEENDIEVCFCDECGKKIPAGSVFCPECGAELGDSSNAEVASFLTLGSFDFSALHNEAKTQLNENELSAFEYEKLSNGKYVIKKLKNKSELIVIVPECVQIIEAEAFADSSVIDVTLPEGLIKIGACAFKNCVDLESINIPSTLRIIEDEAFSGCEQLDLEKPKKVRCGENAFKNTLPWIQKENERKLKEEEDAKAKAEEERKAKAKAKAEAKAKERKRKEEAERKQKQEEYERQLNEKEEHNNKMAIVFGQLEKDMDVGLRPLFEKRFEAHFLGNADLADAYFSQIKQKIVDIVHDNRQRMEEAHLMEHYEKTKEFIKYKMDIIMEESKEIAINRLSNQ